MIAAYLAVYLMIWMPLSGLTAILVICALLALPFIIWADFLRLDPAHIRQVEGILDDVRIPDPKSVANMYPHELSGGMRQRVMIGMMMREKNRVKFPALNCVEQTLVFFR